MFYFITSAFSQIGFCLLKVNFQNLFTPKPFLDHFRLFSSLNPKCCIDWMHKNRYLLLYRAPESTPNKLQRAQNNAACMVLSLFQRSQSSVSCTGNQCATLTRKSVRPASCISEQSPDHARCRQPYTFCRQPTLSLITNFARCSLGYSAPTIWTFCLNSLEQTTRTHFTQWRRSQLQIALKGISFNNRFYPARLSTQRLTLHMVLYKFGYNNNNNYYYY